MPDPIQQMNAQWFPQYFPMGPKAFQDGAGAPSGLVGATAELSKDIPNWPIQFLGLRLTNVYPLPESPGDLDVALYTALKRFVDDEQTVRISLSQQNITAEPTLQVQLTGKSGVYWAPFPIPFPMAGGNNIAVSVVRSTSYPALGGEPVEPQVYATILAVQARNSEQTMAPHRVFAPTPR